MKTLNYIIDPDDWMEELVRYITLFNFDQELEDALLESYGEFEVWKDAYERGLNPHDAFDEEVSQWSYE